METPSGFAVFANAEIRAVRVMQHQRAHARFRIHHEALRKLHADFFRLQELPKPRLILEMGARWIAKAVALPAVARSEPFRHGHLWRVRESPILANPPVQPFRRSF